MPKKGYRSISLREEVYNVLAGLAEKNNRSISAQIKTIVEEREKSIKKEGK